MQRRKYKKTRKRGTQNGLFVTSACECMQIMHSPTSNYARMICENTKMVPSHANNLRKHSNGSFDRISGLTPYTHDWPTTQHNVMRCYVYKSTSQNSSSHYIRSPWASRASISAEAPPWSARSKATTFKWPRLHAIIRGVVPVEVMGAKSASMPIKSVTQSSHLREVQKRYTTSTKRFRSDFYLQRPWHKYFLITSMGD